MNQKAIEVLEYGKIIALLEQQAGAGMTRRAIAALRPSDDPHAIRDALAETDEAVRLIESKGPLPLGGFYDIAASLSYAQKGGTLTMKRLLHIHYNMKTARETEKFLHGDEVPELPILRSIVEVLALFPDLEEDLDRCILSEDEMSDNASTELRDIRRAIVRQNDALRARLEQMIGSQDNRTVLQDALVTIREGRYVLPVKVENRSRVPGIVHDQSASGQTLFIEPQVIVNMNNELRELELAEQAEIERILGELSERVAACAAPLRNNQDLLLQLDLINARGRLAQLQEAVCPILDEDGVLELRQARHPLIDPQKVVPIDVRLGDSCHALIITGPNTGGKTVTLKTCGLLAMMAQSGLHIPAAPGSRLPVYRDIFADIGDEQSIEQSLSTFSSHMNNIVDILRDAGTGTLALIDELGAGTDPAEGAALAVAILERLQAQGAVVMATTHYNELKKYALTADDVENASMEFDVATLSPTYRLRIGTPGRSNAFEISRKLGLDAAMIDRARELMEGGDLAFEDVLSQIEADKKAAERERDEALALNREMTAQKEAADAALQQAKEEETKILNEARSRARGIIREAREVSREVQQELKELNRVESLGERNRRFAESRHKLKDAAGRYREEFIREVNDRPVDLSTVRVGDRVKVLSLGQNGEVIALPDDKGELTVQVGMMKIRVGVDDLKLIQDGRKKKKKRAGGRAGYGGLYRSKAQTVAREVDVRGQTLDEASANVAKYLDDAFMAGLREATIIHGRGEGVLKEGIRRELKRSRHVDSFRRGGYNEGGDGVTIVRLKAH